MKLRFIFAIAAGAGLFATPVMAVTTTGTVAVTLTLTNGCLVNGSPAQTGVNFGSLNFGTSVATFDTLSATFSGGGTGGNTFNVQCTAGASYTVALTSSLNAAPTTVYGTVGTPGRYLISPTATTQGIAYSVYGTSAMTTALANGATLTAVSTSGNTSSYALWGKIVGVADNTNVLAGAYADTLNITITY